MERVMEEKLKVELEKEVNTHAEGIEQLVSFSSENIVFYLEFYG